MVRQVVVHPYSCCCSSRAEPRRFRRCLGAMYFVVVVLLLTGCLSFNYPSLDVRLSSCQHEIQLDVFFCPGM